MSRDWITPGEVARMLDLTEAYVRDAHCNPRTRTYRVLVVKVVDGPNGGKRYKVLKASVISYLEAQILDNAG